ncbi:MAG: hypothetical protein U1A78_17235 [Polyangia bacterium]
MRNRLRQLLLLGLSAGLLPGCGPREEKVRSGLYGFKDSYQPQPVISSAFALQIDREAATLRLLHGADIRAVRTLTARPSDRWIQNCQTNFSGSLLEVLELGDAPLALDALTLQHPVLTSSCNFDSPQPAVVLREGGTGRLPPECYESACVTFQLTR